MTPQRSRLARANNGVRYRDGKFINTLRGHVAPIYQCAFSADSRLLVTASKDTTLKVWSMATYKLSVDLPGHQDEVFAVGLPLFPHPLSCPNPTANGMPG